MWQLSKKRVYLDYAAATPVDKEVLRSMLPAFTEDFANPSSLHKEGQEARKLVYKSRESIARILKIKPAEIIFTSGGTESNNLAILGFFHNLKKERDLKDLHAICLEIEHSSVLKCFSQLKEEGLNVDYLKVLPDGRADLDELKKILRPETVFVSAMLVNNEIGTIQPIKEMSSILNRFAKHSKSARAVLHCDASQAPLYLEVEPERLGIDLMTLDSSKFYGPKGIGLLYVRKGIKLDGILYGGGQEGGKRPGTLNVPSIVGLSKALEIAVKNRAKEINRLTKLKDEYIEKILEEVPGSILNGSKIHRIANNINIFIPGIESEFSVLKLDKLGVSVSSESACLLEGPGGSYVVKAVGGERFENGASIRVSMGKDTVGKDLEIAKNALKKLVKMRISEFDK